MDIDALLKARDEILAIAQRHGASNVRVFGSVARGKAGPDSAVDILVDLELGRSLLDHAQLQIDLEALLGRKVDVVTARGLRPHLRDRVLQEAVPCEGRPRTARSIPRYPSGGHLTGGAAAFPDGTMQALLAVPVAWRPTRSVGECARAGHR